MPDAVSQFVRPSWVRHPRHHLEHFTQAFRAPDHCRRWASNMIPLAAIEVNRDASEVPLPAISHLFLNARDHCRCVLLHARLESASWWRVCRYTHFIDQGAMLCRLRHLPTHCPLMSPIHHEHYTPIDTEVQPNTYLTARAANTHQPAQCVPQILPGASLLTSSPSPSAGRSHISHRNR